MTADAGRLRRFLDALSDDPLVRATSIQSAIFAFGTGTFITGEAVYSIKIIGLTVGALFGGVALATGSLTVIRLIPILTAAILLAGAAMIRRLPAAAAQPAESRAPLECGPLRKASFLPKSSLTRLRPPPQPPRPGAGLPHRDGPEDVPAGRGPAAAFMVASCLIILATDHTAIYLADHPADLARPRDRHRRGTLRVPRLLEPAVRPERPVPARRLPGGRVRSQEAD